MKHVNKSVLLWYSPSEMYQLVTAIEDYPRFLPWCDHAAVIERHDDGVTARIGLAYAGVKHAFTTRNEHMPGTAVIVKLVDGPFSLLDGTWAFLPLGRPGSLQDRVRPALCVCQQGSRNRAQPGLRPRGQYLCRILRHPRRSRVWPALIGTR
jgi:hypothetical protein